MAITLTKRRGLYSLFLAYSSGTGQLAEATIAEEAKASTLVTSATETSQT